jgi:RHS repeat-associated protein
LPGGAYITNTFDPVARLLSTVLKNSTNGVLNSHQYGYDPAGERVWQTNTFRDYHWFTYDKIGQLIGASGCESNGASRLQDQLAYAYDAAHNLNGRTNNNFWENFSVNNLDELSTVSRSTTNLTVAGTTTSPATNVSINGSAANRYADSTFALPGFSLATGNNTFTAIAQDSLNRRDTNSITVNLPASASYTYDLNGNLLSDGTRSFAYDDGNQLISVYVTNVWRSDFVYDGKMRRRLRFESTWNGSAWVTNTAVRYIYDGNLVLQERDANNLPLVSYTRGRDLSGTLQGAGGIGGLLARTDHALSAITSTLSIAPYHCDGNGNVTALIYPNQTIAARYSYDPYGSLVSKSGPLADANPYRFSSKEMHTNSGLVYYLYRLYDPSLQRWLNRDPIQEEGAFNLYQFVENEPQEHVDAFGEFCVGCPPRPPYPRNPKNPWHPPHHDDPDPDPPKVPVPPVPPTSPSPTPKPPHAQPSPKDPICGPGFNPDPDKCRKTGEDAEKCYYNCPSPGGPWNGFIVKPSPNWKCPDNPDVGQVKPIRHPGEPK